jgi:hypothetical protein
MLNQHHSNIYSAPYHVQPLSDFDLNTKLAWNLLIRIDAAFTILALLKYTAPNTNVLGERMRVCSE